MFLYKVEINLLGRRLHAWQAPAWQFTRVSVFDLSAFWGHWFSALNEPRHGSKPMAMDRCMMRGALKELYAAYESRICYVMLCCSFTI